MSLDTYDLDLFDELREVVDEVKSARLILVEEENPENENPYEPSVPVYTKHFDGAAFALKQLSAEQARYEFGAVDASYYKCSIATPDPVISFQQGWYGHINFSRGLQVIEGVVERVDYKLSSLIDIYINTTTNVPFSFEQFL